MKKWLLSLFSLLLLAQNTATAQTQTFGPPYRVFGQWVLHDDVAWDRYLMYFSSNSTVLGCTESYPPSFQCKPANSYPAPGTAYFNSTCNTWYADRIWLTWHFGDGRTPSGWNQPDVYGNTPPLLMLAPGSPGSGESALIGDPSVVYWGGQWHMYYEGTDDCSGSNNRIFHATAPQWWGPWARQGQVNGLWAMLTGSGLSWPTVFVENGNLFLYFTDGYVRLMAAWATDSSGHNFVMMNFDGYQPLGLTNPAPVTSDLVNRGQVVRESGQYKLFYDNFGRSQVKVAASSSPFSFSPGFVLFGIDPGQPWQNCAVGLPSYVPLDARLYYTGEACGSNSGAIGVYP